MSGEKIVSLVANRNRTAPGCIYVIESRCKKLVKIGRSTNPQQRITVIANMAGGVSRTFVSGLVIDAVAVESALHNGFVGARVKGEWFVADFPTTVAIVKEVSNQFAASSESMATKKKVRNGKGDKIMNGIMRHFGFGEVF